MPMRLGEVEDAALVSHMNGVAMVMQRCLLPLLCLWHQICPSVAQISQSPTWTAN